MQRQAVRDAGAPPPAMQGRGIVTSVFDKQFVSAWVLLCELARLGVDLPVEAWHRPGELSPTQRALAETLPLKLTFHELRDEVSGFAVKPHAILRSGFREVLWLDADNLPIRDPSFLFEDPEYRQKGSLFWRDLFGPERVSRWHRTSPVWDAFNVPFNDAEEFETGQLVLDKARCWTELMLTVHFNRVPEVYHQLVHGDKDTFRLAWQNLAFGRTGVAPKRPYHGDPAQVPYGFMPYGPFHMGRPNGWGKWGGGTIMVQRDRDGAPLFNHRNLQKFQIEGNHFNPDIANEATYHAHVGELKRRLDALRG